MICDERVAEIGDGFTVFYGAKDSRSCDVIEITVKGFFTPTDERSGYQQCAEMAGRMVHDAVSNMLWRDGRVDGHYIVTTDMTERGIRAGKRCKMKYQMFVRPKERGDIGTHEGLVMSLVGKADKEVRRVLGSNGFEVPKDDGAVV